MADQKDIIRSRILAETSDLVTNFLHYNRKDDEELPPDSIQKAVKDGVITVNEIVQKFHEELRAGLRHL